MLNRSDYDDVRPASFTNPSKLDYTGAFFIELTNLAERSRIPANVEAKSDYLMFVADGDVTYTSARGFQFRSRGVPFRLRDKWVRAIRNEGKGLLWKNPDAD